LWKKRIALNSLIEIDLVGMGRKRRTLKIQWEKKKTSISKSIRGRALRQGTAVCRNGCEATAGLSNRRSLNPGRFGVDPLVELVTSAEVFAHCLGLEIISSTLNTYLAKQDRGS
jgi:hypothetical protein